MTLLNFPEKSSYYILVQYWSLLVKFLYFHHGGTYIGGTCIGGTCVGGTCVGGTCVGGTCVGGTCVGGTCVGGGGITLGGGLTLGGGGVRHDVYGHVGGGWGRGLAPWYIFSYITHKQMTSLYLY